MTVLHIPAHLAKLSQQCVLVSTAAANDAEALLHQGDAQYCLVQRKGHPAGQADTGKTCSTKHSTSYGGWLCAGPATEVTSMVNTARNKQAVQYNR